MPNRILKDSICTSETIDGLSEKAELFFYRLLVQCDDYGRMDARPAVLRARCFPLRLNGITDEMLSAWLDDLVRAGLVWIYEVEGRPYLQVTKWEHHQQVRAKRSKFPEPPPKPKRARKRSRGNPVTSSDINGYQMPAAASDCARESLSESLSESKSNAEEGAGKHPPRRPPAVDRYRAIAGRYPDKAQWQAIARAVGDDPGRLAFWGQVVEVWILRGWNKLNVAGMLEFFGRNELPSLGKPGRNSHAPVLAGEATPLDTDEQVRAEYLRLNPHKRPRQTP